MAGGPKNKWAIAVAVALGALLEIIDTSIVNVALKEMQASLGATLSEVSWVISSYGIANVIILPLAAWLGHRFGKKRYFLFSLFGFVAASILCGISTNLWMLVLARVLQGLTGGGLLAKAQAILFETFPKEEQATAQGFFGAIVIAGPTLGPTLGGYIVTNIGWRWIFFINVPLGILAIAMVAASLPADEHRTEKNAPIDWVSIGLLALGLGSLQFFLEEGNSHDWFDSKLITVLFVAAIVGCVAFIMRELKSKNPVVDLKVLRYRSLWAGSLLSIIVGMALYGGLFAIPIYAQSFLQYTSQTTGMLLLPGALAFLAVMPFIAKLSRARDPRVILAIGATLLASTLFVLGGLSPQTGGNDLFWPLLVRGMATVMMFLPLQLAAFGPIPKEEIASATGLFALTRQLGGATGVALLTVLLEKRTAFHYGVVSEKLVANDPGVIDRLNALTQGMLAKGVPFNEARQRALALLDATVRQQAAVMSFADTFWATAALIVMFLPLVFLLGKPNKEATVEMGH